MSEEETSSPRKTAAAIQKRQRLAKIKGALAGGLSSSPFTTDELDVIEEEASR